MILEDALKAAEPIIPDAAGHIAQELHRRLEDPNRFLP